MSLLFDVISGYTIL